MKTPVRPDATKYEAVKDIVGFIGLCIMFAMSLVIQVTFLAAYWSGDYEILVTINEYGEAMMELYLIPIFLILGLYGIYWYIHEAWTEESERI